VLTPITVERQAVEQEKQILEQQLDEPKKKLVILENKHIAGQLLGPENELLLDQYEYAVDLLMAEIRKK